MFIEKIEKCSISKNKSFIDSKRLSGRAKRSAHYETVPISFKTLTSENIICDSLVLSLKGQQSENIPKYIYSMRAMNMLNHKENDKLVRRVCKVAMWNFLSRSCCFLSQPIRGL